MEPEQTPKVAPGIVCKPLFLMVLRMVAVKRGLKQFRVVLSEQLVQGVERASVSFHAFIDAVIW